MNRLGLFYRIYTRLPTTRSHVTGSAPAKPFSQPKLRQPCWCCRSFNPVILLAFLVCPLVVAQQIDAQIDHETDVKLENRLILDEPLLNESSGLAASRRNPGHFWSHNDSGDTARLFAFDPRGKRSGLCELDNAGAVDWEDMAAIRHQDRCWLLVADSGDNRANRRSISLYLFEEPDPTKETRVTQFTEIVVTYPDGPRDCEAVAIDGRRKKIVLIAKSRLPLTQVYTIDLPPLDQPLSRRMSVTADYVAPLAMPMVTAADMDESTGDLWIINYFVAFRFRSHGRQETLAEQLKSMPIQVELPRLKQIEAVCLDEQKRLWVTSEGTPTPLVSVPLPESKP